MTFFSHVEAQVTHLTMPMLKAKNKLLFTNFIGLLEQLKCKNQLYFPSLHVVTKINRKVVIFGQIKEI